MYRNAWMRACAIVAGTSILSCVVLVCIVGTAMTLQSQACSSYHDSQKEYELLPKASCSIALIDTKSGIDYYLSEKFLEKAAGNLTCLARVNFSTIMTFCENEDGSIGRDVRFAKMPKFSRQYGFDGPCRLSCDEVRPGSGRKFRGPNFADDGIGGGIAMKIHIVETSPDRWGTDFGAVDLGPKMSGSVSGSGGQVTNAAGHGSAKVDPIITQTNKVVFPWAWISRDNLISYDSKRHLFSPMATYVIAILGYAILKVLKTLGMVTTLGVHIFKLECHIVEFYISAQRLKKLNDCQWWIKWPIKGLIALVEYIVMTWAPNLAVSPLASIVEGEFANTARITGDPSMNSFICLVILVGLSAGALVIISDRILTNSETGEYPTQMTTCRKIARCLTAFLRFVVLVMVAACVVAILLALSMNWYIIFGIDISYAFKFSFNFGLLGWAAFLRFLISLQIIVELGLSIYLNTLFLHEKDTETTKDDTTLPDHT